MDDLTWNYPSFFYFQYAQALGSGSHSVSYSKGSTKSTKDSPRSNFYVHDSMDGKDENHVQETGEVVKTEFSSKYFSSYQLNNNHYDYCCLYRELNNKIREEQIILIRQKIHSNLGFPLILWRAVAENYIYDYINISKTITVHFSYIASHSTFCLYRRKDSCGQTRSDRQFERKDG